VFATDDLAVGKPARCARPAAPGPRHGGSLLRVISPGSRGIVSGLWPALAAESNMAKHAGSGLQNGLDALAANDVEQHQRRAREPQPSLLAALRPWLGGELTITAQGAAGAVCPVRNSRQFPFARQIRPDARHD
jgi:hypothetical protein